MAFRQAGSTRLNVAPTPFIVVFADVDSLAIASGPASFGAAARALRQLATERVAVAFSSSRTRAELEHLWQGGLGASHPLIVERGGALFLPHHFPRSDATKTRDIAGYRVMEFGKPYQSVTAALRHVSERLRIRVRGFNDMSIEEVARASGVTLLQARLAKLREYGELFQILDADSESRTALRKGLHSAGLRMTSAEPYEHVGCRSGVNVAMEALSGLHRRAFGRVQSVGIADAMSDGELLRTVDCPVFVERGDAPALAACPPRPPLAPVAFADNVGALADLIVDLVRRLRRAAHESGPQVESGALFRM
jgi:mannosyl-3-phosphoglycerate phosphatase